MEKKNISARQSQCMKALPALFSPVRQYIKQQTRITTD